jgi:hypothetical protein
MIFDRKSEILAAEATAILIDGVAAVLFFACAFVWLAILGTAP